MVNKAAGSGRAAAHRHRPIARPLTRLPPPARMTSRVAGGRAMYWGRVQLAEAQLWISNLVVFILNGYLMRSLSVCHVGGPLPSAAQTRRALHHKFSSPAVHFSLGPPTRPPPPLRIPHEGRSAVAPPNRLEGGGRAPPRGPAGAPPRPREVEPRAPPSSLRNICPRLGRSAAPPQACLGGHPPPVWHTIARKVARCGAAPAGRVS